MIAPTAMLGMNNPHGIYNNKCIENITGTLQCTVSQRIIRINEYSISNHVGITCTCMCIYFYAKSENGDDSFEHKSKSQHP